MQASNPPSWISSHSGRSLSGLNFFVCRDSCLLFPFSLLNDKSEIQKSTNIFCLLTWVPSIFPLYNLKLKCDIQTHTKKFSRTTPSHTNCTHVLSHSTMIQQGTRKLFKFRHLLYTSILKGTSLF